MELKEVTQVLETDTYLVYVSGPVEEVAREAHYAVFNKEFNVVEFRTPVLSNAAQYAYDAQETYESITGGELERVLNDNEVH